MFQCVFEPTSDGLVSFAQYPSYRHARFVNSWSLNPECLTVSRPPMSTPHTTYYFYQTFASWPLPLFKVYTPPNIHINFISFQCAAVITPRKQLTGWQARFDYGSKIICAVFWFQRLSPDDHHRSKRRAQRLSAKCIGSILLFGVCLARAWDVEESSREISRDRRRTASVRLK